MLQGMREVNIWSGEWLPNGETPLKTERVSFKTLPLLTMREILFPAKRTLVIEKSHRAEQACRKGYR